MPVRRSASLRSCSADGEARPEGKSKTMKSLPAPCIFVKSMRIPPRIAESSQCGTIPENTAIHYGEYPREDRLLSASGIDDAVLQPKSGHTEPDAVIDDRCNMYGAAKHIDDVNLLTGPQDIVEMIQIGHRLLTQDRVSHRGHGDDTVAETLKLARHAMARPRGIRRQANNRNDARR